jgi:transposase
MDTPTVQDIAIHFALINFNKSIQDVADEFGVGRHKVIRAMNRVKAHGTGEFK